VLLQLRTVVVHPRSVQLRPVVDKVAQRQLCHWVHSNVYCLLLLLLHHCFIPIFIHGQLIASLSKTRIFLSVSESVRLEGNAAQTFWVSKLYETPCIVIESSSSKKAWRREKLRYEYVFILFSLIYLFSKHFVHVYLLYSIIISVCVSWIRS
jgi:hypothetical protein